MRQRDGIAICETDFSTADSGHTSLRVHRESGRLKRRSARDIHSRNVRTYDDEVIVPRDVLTVLHKRDSAVESTGFQLQINGANLRNRASQGSIPPTSIKGG